VREVFVDYNRVGWAKRVYTRVFRTEREGLQVGATVLAIGDAVEPRPARVTSIAGSDVELEFVEPLDRRQVSRDLG
jgi:FKBP-type peptidyl-prolyl cis-trans isomerase 2